jgi:hypothetical protein
MNDTTPAVPNDGTSNQHPSLLGFAVAADLWFWGVMLFYAPTYFAVSGLLSSALTALGFCMVVGSVAGALLELGKLRKNEALSYWGIGAAAVLLAGGVHLAVARADMSREVELVARAAVYLALAVGAAMIFQGIAYGLRNPVSDAPSSDSGIEDQSRSRSRFLSLSQTLAATLLALVSLATAVVQFLRALYPGTGAPP